MTSRPYLSAAKAPASAASTCPSAAWRAASALDASGTHSPSGRLAASQPRHCGMACGWPPILLMSPSPVPGLASSANAMGICSSAMMTRSFPVGQVIEGGGDDTLDRALDGNHGPFRRAFSHGGQGGLDGGAGQRLGAGVGGAQRRLGEGPSGPR